MVLLVVVLNTLVAIIASLSIVEKNLVTIASLYVKRGCVLFDALPPH